MSMRRKWILTILVTGVALLVVAALRAGQGSAQLHAYDQWSADEVLALADSR